MLEDLRNFAFNPRRIEPLVVILILAVLAAFSIGPILSIQKNIRDSKRKADLESLQTALELAKTNGFYPPNMPPSVFEKANYIKNFPFDPQSPKAEYVYKPSPQNCKTNCQGYTLTSCLEREKDQQKDNVKVGCETYPASYTVTNP